MKYYVYYIFLVSVGQLFWQCGDDNSDKCFDIKPDSAYFNIKVSINKQNPFVPLSVFDGRYETQKLILQDTLYFDTTKIYLKVEKYYTFVANYNYNNKTIKAIRGQRIHIYNEIDEQGNTCWKIPKTLINLTLR